MMIKHDLSIFPSSSAGNLVANCTPDPCKHLPRLQDLVQCQGAKPGRNLVGQKPSCSSPERGSWSGCLPSQSAKTSLKKFTFFFHHPTGHFLQLLQQKHIHKSKLPQKFWKFNEVAGRLLPAGDLGIVYNFLNLRHIHSQIILSTRSFFSLFRGR